MMKPKPCIGSNGRVLSPEPAERDTALGPPHMGPPLIAVPAIADDERG